MSHVSVNSFIFVLNINMLCSMVSLTFATHERKCGVCLKFLELLEVAFNMTMCCVYKAGFYSKIYDNVLCLQGRVLFRDL